LTFITQKRPFSKRAIAHALDPNQESAMICQEEVRGGTVVRQRRGSGGCAGRAVGQVVVAGGESVTAYSCSAR